MYFMKLTGLFVFARCLRCLPCGNGESVIGSEDFYFGQISYKECTAVCLSFLILLHFKSKTLRKILDRASDIKWVFL
jgi:hypothetical protein